jgi:hypothetical protein
LVLYLERTSHSLFEVAVINPGAGVESFHISSSVTKPPVVQSRIVMRFMDVSRDRLMQDG